MKPSPLDYVRATSVEHAVELLSGDADVRILAGGQSLMPVINLRLASPELVVDIGRIDELRSIEITPASPGSAPLLRIGAAVTQAEAALHPDVQARWPLLAAAIAEIGHPQIRNRGTVCGSLAHNDPQAELPAAAIALQATIVALSPRGVRLIPAADMFAGPFMTNLADDELVTAVEFPEPAAGHGWSFREFTPRTGDFATAGVAAVMHRTGGQVESHLVTFGLGDGPTRATVVEQALLDASGPDLAANVVDAWAAALDPYDDEQCSAAAKTQHARRLIVQAVAEAWERMA